MGRDLSTEIAGHVLLVACGPDVPREQDFSDFLHAAQAADYRSLWVHTAGGYYDALQRQRAASVIRAASRVAIMADSRIARGAAIAFSWVVNGVRAFGGDEFTQARAYLDASEHTEQRLRAMVDGLR